MQGETRSSILRTDTISVARWSWPGPLSSNVVLKNGGGLEKLGVLRPPIFVKSGLEKSEKAKKWS